MAIHYRSQGIVLQKRDFREADRFYLVFTQEFGKLELFGKSIRKSQAKMKSLVEPLNLCEIEFIQGKNYKTLTDVILKNNFPWIKKDLIRLKLAFSISELFANLLPEEEKDLYLWQILLEVLEELNNYRLSSLRYTIFYYYYFWRFLIALGYTPQLEYCLNCQKKIALSKDRHFYFHFQEASIICPRCQQKNPEVASQDINCLKFLKLILAERKDILEKLKISRSDLHKFGQFSQRYLNSLKEVL